MILDDLSMGCLWKLESIVGFTLRLFNIAMENPQFLMGKTSISMGHGCHGYVK
jgi:hypothetical protein